MVDNCFCYGERDGGSETDVERTSALALAYHTKMAGLLQLRQLHHNSFMQTIDLAGAADMVVGDYRKAKQSSRFRIHVARNVPVPWK